MLARHFQEGTEVFVVVTKTYEQPSHDVVIPGACPGMYKIQHVDSQQREIRCGTVGKVTRVELDHLTCRVAFSLPEGVFTPLVPAQHLRPMR